MVYCTLGHISKNSIKYNAVSKQYSVLFSDLKVGRGQPGKDGVIYFDEKVVRMSGKYFVEIDMCQETYKMYVFNSEYREVIDVPLESIVKSRYKGAILLPDESERTEMNFSGGLERCCLCSKWHCPLEACYRFQDSLYPGISFPYGYELV